MPEVIPYFYEETAMAMLEQQYQRDVAAIKRVSTIFRNQVAPSDLPSLADVPPFPAVAASQPIPAREDNGHTEADDLVVSAGSFVRRAHVVALVARMPQKFVLQDVAREAARYPFKARDRVLLHGLRNHVEALVAAGALKREKVHLSYVYTKKA